MNDELQNMDIQNRAEPKATRKIYNGTTLNQKDEPNPRGNRHLKSRRRSPFKIITIIFFTSVLIVFYIWNKICVNKLVVEVSDLQNRYEKIINANEFIRADINKKSSLERIEKQITTNRLTLISPKEQPIWFELNESRLEQIQH